MPEHLNKTNLLVISFLVLICIIIYGNSLLNPFVWDDSWLIQNNPLIRSFNNIPKLFQVNLTYSRGAFASNFYRPLQSLSHMIDYLFFGLQPFGYHAINIILHAINAVLVYFLILLITKQKVASFVSSLLFAVHPIHVEAVTYISGRADLLVAFFILLSLIFFIVYSECAKLKRIIFYSISVLCFILALLSKELAIVFPLTLIVYDLSFRRKNLRDLSSFLRAYALFIIIDLIYILLRLTILNFGLGVYLTGNYPLYSRLIILSHSFNIYFRLLVLPLDLHMCRIFGLYLSLSNPITFFSVLSFALAVILLILSYKRARLIFFSGAWYIILFLPQSGIYPINAFAADHFLYLPSIGFFLIIGFLMTRYLPRRIFTVSVMALTCFYATTTAINNYGWRNEGQLYKRIIKLSPLCTNAYVNLGVYYRDRGLLDEAEKQFKKAIAIDKFDHAKRVYLAEVYFLQNKLDKAIDELKAVLQNSSKNKNASIFSDIGYMYQLKKSYALAIDYYKQALEIDPNFTLARCNLARAYFDLGRTKECFVELEKAIGIEGLLTFNDNKGPTEKELKEAIKQNKEYGGIFNELAVLFIKYNRFEIAEKVFLRTIELYPNSVETRFNLGVLYYNLGLYAKAKAQWHSVLKINPRHLPSLEWLRIVQNK